jgi:hypothetical protein
MLSTWRNILFPEFGRSGTLDACAGCPGAGLLRLSSVDKK